MKELHFLAWSLSQSMSPSFFILFAFTSSCLVLNVILNELLCWVVRLPFPSNITALNTLSSRPFVPFPLLSFFCSFFFFFSRTLPSFSRLNELHPYSLSFYSLNLSSLDTTQTAKGKINLKVGRLKLPSITNSGSQLQSKRHHRHHKHHHHHRESDAKNELHR